MALERAARRWGHGEATAALGRWHAATEALRDRLAAETECELLPARRGGGRARRSGAEELPVRTLTGRRTAARLACG